MLWYEIACMHVLGCPSDGSPVTLDAVFPGSLEARRLVPILEEFPQILHVLLVSTGSTQVSRIETDNHVLTPLSPYACVLEASLMNQWVVSNEQLLCGFLGWTRDAFESKHVAWFCRFKYFSQMQSQLVPFFENRMLAHQRSHVVEGPRVYW